MPVKTAHLIACHECDLVHQLGEVPPGGAARCARCGSPLYRPKRDSINRTLALTMTGLLLFIIANTNPFLGFKIGAQIRETILATGIYQLYQQDMRMIATLVLFTVVIVPALSLVSMLYILVPLQMKMVPRHLARVFRLLGFLKPWGMLEIFMLGILVSAVKLGKMATIIPGVALFAFLALIFVQAAMAVTLDSHLIWEQLDRHQ
ncbi:MAG: paraquat-inducible protein A [Deltaproteobacteria bacterium]|nr:paraquat-inducible protein A [Deltaproteobacteria bacterium]